LKIKKYYIEKHMKKLKITLFLLVVLAFSSQNVAIGQTDTSGIFITGGGNVGIGTPEPDSSAVLDMSSSTKGFLLPRMTIAQRNAIPGPVEGLMVYCTDCGSLGAISIYSGGAWVTFSHCIASSPIADTNFVTPGQVIWKWTAVAGASGYKWNTENNYLTAIDMITATSKTETGIVCDSIYTRFVWTYNTCGVSEPLIQTEALTAATPAAPTTGAHIATINIVVWNWNSVAEAEGYKWNTVNEYASATDMTTSLTKTEIGLVYNTLYTRYVWAYNGCGYSTPVTLTQATLLFTCGNPITIYHVAGNVAPVTKTVTYGTITNIPGDPSKCWITSNLGADHQAYAFNDDTEASAGWYWQFNRKQGYKYECTNRTPNTTWITPINEDYEWQAANDPCALEFGCGWRLPSISEWQNISWSLPFNGSNFKLHAAGILSENDGSLGVRGNTGRYWSSSHYTSSNCYYLHVSETIIGNIYTAPRAWGFSSRCIRD
jgi:hypothetical protein